MKRDNSIQLFEEKTVRTLWVEAEEKWYFSVIDVIEVLTNSDRPRKYWNDVKSKLKKEGSQLSEQIGQLKLKSSDGKSYKTDVADTEQLFRLIQSIPSPKAEPFKQWLAQIAAERLDEMQDPELTIDRALGAILATRLLGKLDQSTPQKHRSPQGTHRRVEKPRTQGRRAICHPHGHHYEGLVRPFHQGIQGPQRLEKGESPRQHDQYRIDFEHVGRSSDQGHFPSGESGIPRRQQKSRPTRWKRRKGSPQRTRIQNRQKSRDQAECQKRIVAPIRR